MARRAIVGRARTPTKAAGKTQYGDKFAGACCVHTYTNMFARSTRELLLCQESTNANKDHVLIGHQEIDHHLHLLIAADLYQAAIHLPERCCAFANKSAPRRVTSKIKKNPPPPPPPPFFCAGRAAAPADFVKRQHSDVTARSVRASLRARMCTSRTLEQSALIWKTPRSCCLLRRVFSTVR